VLAAVAACSSSLPATTPPATTRAAAATTRAAVTTPAAATPKTVDGDITIAPAGSMAPGPMKITPVYCGKFTAAQQSEYGTTAAGGFVYRFVNDSANLVAAPKVDVDFTSGTTVAGSNVTADPTQVSPGKTGTGEVDAVGASGQVLPLTGCEVMSYALITSSGAGPASYAG
jgi:hypothetical protein